MTVRDGERVERAIHFLQRHHHRQPSLDDVAAAVGLSPYHFQRLFKRWAGVTPKRFVQFLTLEHAKAALEAGRSVLDASYDAGLSGPGRLHDLFVAIDAVTPGEFKERGQAIVIRYGFHPTPFGESLIAVTSRGVCGLTFIGATDRSGALDDLRHRWRDADLRRDQRTTGSVAQRLFSGSGEHRRITLDLRGTNFQIKVWEALLRVPAGTLVAYGDVARRIGQAGAVRAVGSAVAANPVAYLIPCHRVILGSGAFGDYRWGGARKQAMIGWEAAHRELAAAG